MTTLTETMVLVMDETQPTTFPLDLLFTLAVVPLLHLPDLAALTLRLLLLDHLSLLQTCHPQPRSRLPLPTLLPSPKLLLKVRRSRCLPQLLLRLR
jgi:hypothetical protein